MRIELASANLELIMQILLFYRLMLQFGRTFKIFDLQIIKVGGDSRQTAVLVAVRHSIIILNADQTVMTIDLDQSPFLWPLCERLHCL